MQNADLVVTEALAKAKCGDSSGYKTLYDLYKDQVLSFCIHITRNIFDAEDLTQEVFLQVYKKLSTFRGEAKFRTWLFQVALNAARMHFRKEHRLKRSGESITDWRAIESIPHPRHRLSNVERMILVHAISTLSKSKRQIVLLHDINGFSHREVARHLGLAEGTSKSQLHKAHKMLRHIIAR